ncbi:methyltransferase (TIGR00027 family) [Amycolatopsis bartoniae]|uniref:S-adenosyl-L-methionine-dependent methyltransferase n=1 Tax=Amycolatopsis bartoniae TaxID=941986 RepID=A0A8H9MED7_9PSEU|nr:SAM-dependent methyltransferase [Amycolatopsis bartoniae]MBB2935551.1 methyltransferase (TIGR00027 family) [Amycolatopsis bartoniae]TVT05262.1 SAM-dependent methyltransferase [Amycolatopsis bartoniae]GHF76718.1 hypothetical protein GCM10017566_58570 [Amycolatopsis bartoniae]
MSAVPGSSTAETAALLRAVGALLPESGPRNPDVLAARLLPWSPSARALVKVPGLRLLIRRAVLRKWPAALWYEVVRTIHLDEVLTAELATGAAQVVLLGAGLDSRAHRLRLGDARVFEVDQAPMSAWKRHRARHLPGADIRYLAANLHDDDLAEALAGGGFEPTARTVVVWSGVTPYLRTEGVEATLRWFARQAPGSSLVFDYCWQEALDGTIPEARAAMRDVAARGEPWRWGIPRGRADDLLTSFGLQLVEDLEVAEAQRRYLTRPDGSVQGPVWFFGGFVHARVPAG